MTLSEAGCVFMSFILYISGVQGENQQQRICAPKGSSVNLTCSDKYASSNKTWFTVYKDGINYVQKELSADGNRVTYKSEERHPTLTINNLTESDEKCYCCRENTFLPKDCWTKRIQLNISDVQVKVIPSTEGQTVTLICSTSCPLTEHPAGYIWYKNREFLYQDWSPWYQQLVSSEEAVTYSCAIRGYEDLRAPQVSVDSVTPACFTVTYAKGRMCPQTSEDEPCSITYPREVHVQRNHESLTCTTSCPETDPKPAYRWYQKGQEKDSESQQISVPLSSTDSFSCAVKGLEDLLSDEVCAEDSNCWSVNYVRRRICALRGSSVNISSVFSHPHEHLPKSTFWYKTGNKKQVSSEKYDDSMKNHHNLRINNLRKDDSAEYTFRLIRQDERWKDSDFPGVTLVVTDLTVTVHPAEVTEGQRVTLTCSTSCPLPDNTTYIWFFNNRSLTPTENQTKHLVLDPVSSQHAGNYSCSVTTPKISSQKKTLTVQRKTGKWISAAAAAGVCSALLVLIILLVVFFWIRKKRTSGQSSVRQATGNTEQLNPDPVYENVSSAQAAEQERLRNSRIHFSKTHTVPLYSTVQPHQPRRQEEVTYAVVNFRPNRSPQKHL